MRASEEVLILEKLSESSAGEACFYQALNFENSESRKIFRAPVEAQRWLSLSFLVFTDNPKGICSIKLWAPQKHIRTAKAHTGEVFGKRCDSLSRKKRFQRKKLFSRKLLQSKSRFRMFMAELVLTLQHRGRQTALK